jgi:hypothetical protein
MERPNNDGLVFESQRRTAPIAEKKEPLMDLWLDSIPADRRDAAVAALDAGEVIEFLWSVDDHFSRFSQNTDRLYLLWKNWEQLRARGHGLYEEALLYAFTGGTQFNNHGFQADALDLLFRLADRRALLAAGDPLPGPGPFMLFRGVAGRGRARRIRGLSWTSDRGQAAWFAHRFGVCGIADPAVFEITVDVDAVLVYSNGRNEQEFIVRVPAAIRPVRVLSGDECKRAAELWSSRIAEHNRVLIEAARARTDAEVGQTMARDRAVSAHG